jgi:Fe-S cluster assembly protein SufD
MRMETAFNNNIVTQTEGTLSPAQRKAWKSFQSLPWRKLDRAFEHVDTSSMQSLPAVIKSENTPRTEDLSDFLVHNDDLLTYVDTALKALALVANQKIHIYEVAENTQDAVVRLDLDAAADNSFSHNYILVDISGNSRATIEVACRGRGKNTLQNTYIQIRAQKGTEIDVVYIQQAGMTASLINSMDILLARDAVAHVIPIISGGNVDDTDIVVHLLEEGARTRNTMIFAANEEQAFSSTITSLHHTRNTVSETQTRGVLGGFAMSHLVGFIKILPQAIGSDANLEQRTLLLGENVRQDTIPRLEVEANDVTAGHAASVSRLDEEELFYAVSRGIDEKTARDMLIEGFLRSLNFEHQHATVTAAIDSIIREKL